MVGAAKRGQKQKCRNAVIGSTWRARLNDHEYVVKVIASRKNESGDSEACIQFSEQDNRNDEWISTSLLSPPASEHSHNNVNNDNPGNFDSKESEVSMVNGLKEDGPKSNASVPLIDTQNSHTPRNIDSINFGLYEIGTWYHSPYPEEYGHPTSKMYICEHCLKYMRGENALRAHKVNCRSRSPPGDVVYQQGDIKIFRIDGKIHKLYSQNLCLMSKLFLDHKSVYYDIEGFMFYVLTEQDQRERRTDNVVGYFSKEKISYENNNLACIMVLPPYQRKGYGKLLIEFSYELAKHENQIGSPEKPLSDLGQRGYRSYWASVVLRVLAQSEDPSNMTIRYISTITYIHPDDIIDAMKYAGLIKYVRPPESDASADTDAVICVTKLMIDEAIKHIDARLYGLIDPSRITWTA
ncbi:hypothetical protein Unana1_02205 [Umbelopsis nana]